MEKRKLDRNFLSKRNGEGKKRDERIDSFYFFTKKKKKTTGPGVAKVFIPIYPIVFYLQIGMSNRWLNAKLDQSFENVSLSSAL